MVHSAGKSTMVDSLPTFVLLALLFLCKALYSLRAQIKTSLSFSATFISNSARLSKYVLLQLMIYTLILTMALKNILLLTNLIFS